MAEKRMFSKKITLSDDFLDMPLSTQAVYMHLAMSADDDGFIGSPRSIMRMIGASNDELNILIAKKFVLSFEDKIIVIKHWMIHNTLRQDRKKPTTYTKELDTLDINENKSYTRRSSVRQVSDKCQHSIVEGSIVEDSIGKSNSYKAFKELVLKDFTENKIATHKAKINGCEEEFKMLKENEDLKSISLNYMQYVKENRTSASRLDKYLLAHIENNIADLNYKDKVKPLTKKQKSEQFFARKRAEELEAMQRQQDFLDVEEIR